MNSYYGEFFKVWLKEVTKHKKRVLILSLLLLAVALGFYGFSNDEKHLLTSGTPANDTNISTNMISYLKDKNEKGLEDNFLEKKGNTIDYYNNELNQYKEEINNVEKLLGLERREIQRLIYIAVKVKGHEEELIKYRPEERKTIENESLARKLLSHFDVIEATNEISNLGNEN